MQLKEMRGWIMSSSRCRTSRRTARTHRWLPRGARAQACVRADRGRARAGVHRQYRDPPRQHRPRRRCGGNGGVARRRAGGNRPHAKYGWALRNRHALMPTREQVERAMQEMEDIRPRYHGRLVIDWWCRITRADRRPAWAAGAPLVERNALRPRAAVPGETIPGLQFWSVRDHPLAEIWRESSVPGIRGTDWMPEPCRSCDMREIDYGGCRCQAMAPPAMRQRRIRHANCRRITRTYRRLPETILRKRTKTTRIAGAPRAAGLLPFQLTRRRGPVGAL